MKKEKGITILLIFIFGAIFLIILIGFINLVSFRYKKVKESIVSTDAFYIAEAGVNYYRWHLIKNPGDIQDGNDWCCQNPPCEVCGPYEHDYYDPYGKKIGKFILEISAKKICGQVLGVYLTSTGFLLSSPELKRKIKVKLAATSIADYAYLLNDNVWAGSDREIYGKYHSNGGIRMDGSSNSLVTSATNEWICTASFGCSSSDCPDGCEPYGQNCKCPGIFGQGSPKDLWKYPVPPFDFEGITADLAKMKELAQAQGRYYPKAREINPEGKGYHLIFNSDGSYTIKIVTEIENIFCYSLEEGWHWCPEYIKEEVPYENNVYLSEDCGLIFIEDNLWVEGTVKGKKTVACANLIDPSKDTTTILNWNIDYTSLDGSDSLAIITEKDVLIPVHSPDNMVLRGVFVAQKGKFGRNHYIYPGDFPWYCWFYPERCFWEAKRESLLIYGTIVSNKRVGTKWSYSNGAWASGYKERKNYFDVNLAKDPPPLLPYVSPSLEFVSWEEVK